MGEKIMGVYKIVNTKTGKIYIGKSKDVHGQWNRDVAKLESGKHRAKKLQSSYSKTKDKGVFQYDIVETAISMSELAYKEQHYIEMYDTYNSGLNSESDNVPHKQTRSQKEKTREKALRMYDEFWELYNNLPRNNLLLSAIHIGRIYDKKYSVGAMSRLIVVLKWFAVNYDMGKYYCKLSYNGNTAPKVHVCVIGTNKAIETFKVVKNNVVSIDNQ